MVFHLRNCNPNYDSTPWMQWKLKYIQNEMGKTEASFWDLRTLKPYLGSNDDRMYGITTVSNGGWSCGLEEASVLTWTVGDWGLCPVHGAMWRPFWHLHWDPPLSQSCGNLNTCFPKKGIVQINRAIRSKLVLSAFISHALRSLWSSWLQRHGIKVHRHMDR